MLNRRQFLQIGTVSPLVAGLGTLGSGYTAGPALASNGTAQAGRGNPHGPAKNVIFLVSDGMSMGTLTAADQYKVWRDGEHSHWIKLYMDRDREVRRGLMDMSSRNNMVTDSAAAAASWGCGHRVNNGSVNLGPDDEEYPVILEIAREAGKATGLVTTTTTTHATPAGFGANVASRGMAEDIARQYEQRRYDVVMGGGASHYDPESREDGEDLFARFASQGHEIVRTREELMALSADARKVLGTFTRSGHLPYDLDRLNDEGLQKEIPTLAEMSEAALDRLNQHGNGFVLQIEGGRVDHAAHANDLGGLLFDQLAFDEAIAVALKFQEDNPDTLVVITTDHGNANPGFQSGPGLGERQFEKISRFKGTNSARVNSVLHSEDVTREEIKDRFKEVLDLALTDHETTMLRDFAREEYMPPYGRMRNPRAMVGQIVARHLDFNWIGGSHSADYVELVALGPGSEAVGPFNRNTDMFDLMVNSLGIEDAKEAVAAAKRRGPTVFA